MFEQTMYEFFVLENFRGILGAITAVDNDLNPEYNQVRYVIVHGDISLPLTIHPNGSLELLRELNFEEDPTQFVFSVSASDNGGLNTSVSVSVSVLDVNEFAPVISDFPSTLEVPETTPIGSILLEVTASDQDGGSFGELNAVQIIHPRTGIPFLGVSNRSIVTTSLIDYESIEKPVFNITIQVCDIGGLCSDRSLTITILDVNELPPVFDPLDYTISISEETLPEPQPGFPENALLKLRLTQQGGSPVSYDVTFSFESSSSSFVVDENGFVVQVSSLDYERDPIVSIITVEAYDGTFRTNQAAVVTITTVNINDNPPTFISLLSQPIWINENEVPNAPLYFFIAEDVDNLLVPLKFDILNSTELEFVNSSFGGSFRVETDDGTLHLVEALDYEKVQVVELFVVASDGELQSDPVSITVNIIGVNDNVPKFTTSFLSVNLSENEPAGTLEVRILAEDADLPNLLFGPEPLEKVRYEIVSSSAPFSVRFDEATGMGIITNDILFDFETMPRKYDFEVKAVDSEGLGSETPISIVIIIIDVNDFLPEFENVTYDRLMFDDSVELDLHVKATDNDGSNQHNAVTYYLVPENIKTNFSIDDNGTIQALTVYDFERGPREINFMVVAENNDGKSSIASIHIGIVDKNDHAPTFQHSNYSFSLPEDTEVPSTVYGVLAIDEDGSEAYGTVREYSLEQTDDELPFEVDPESGLIILVDALDFEVGPREYTLTVTADDGEGLTGKTLVFIAIENVNDNPACPTETHLEASVEENTVPTQQLLTINVLDIDQMQTELRFILIGEYASDLTINPSGELYLLQPQNFEDTSLLFLNVQVVDDTLTCPFLLNITVEIQDLNDNFPVIIPIELELTIEENSVELTLTSFTATDMDGSSQFSTISQYIIESQEPGEIVPFLITNNGELSAERSLDAEADSALYRLFVYALDGLGLRSQPANVTIHVENINDHQPEFKQSEYHIFIPVDVSVYTTVVEVTATDGDIGVYGQLMYSLVESVPFSIDAANGSIYITGSFNSESETSSYSFTVVATDGGGFMASTQITIELNIDNEFVPQIQELNYTTCIDEGTELGTAVLTVLLADDSIKFNESIQFEIRGGDVVPFDVSTEGNVITKNFITDYESGHTSFTFSVAAVSMAGHSSQPVEVVVCINNINDNRPFFEPRGLNLTLEENFVGFVTNVEAIDPDGEIYKLAYSILGESNGFKLFQNGSLYLESPIDYEQTKEVLVSITANDTNFISEILQVTVSVLNVNDNPPVFAKTSYTVELFENEPSSTVLEVLQASDEDASEIIMTSPTPPFALVMRYEILESDIPFEVRLDPGTNNGLLVNTEMMDFERDSCSYNFTVAAFDGGGVVSELNTSVTVLLQNLNDNEVQFMNDTYHFSVMENYIGDVGIVKITDRDYTSRKKCPSSQSKSLDDFDYTVFGQNVPEGVITINQEGLLTITQPFDYETSNKQLEIVVSAVDGFYTAITTVFVSLEDENEFCPDVRDKVVSISIPETTTPGSEIYRIVSMDADGSDSSQSTLFEILSNNSLLPFSVSEDGAIVITSFIDYEKNQTLHTFLVRIYDNSGDCDGLYMMLQVEITNVNDEPPYFVESTYSFVVSESLQPGSLVGQIMAKDPDVATKASLSNLQFTIEPNTVPFAINITGEIFLEGMLDFEGDQLYTFVVHAHDGLFKSLQPSIVTVTVSNVNEHSPEFIGPFTFDLPENEVDTFRVNIIDRDDERMGEVVRFTINSTSNDFFTIDNQGYIANTLPFDYEAAGSDSNSSYPRTFRLTVCAYDVGDKHSCDNFTINLQDVNDNAPHFSMSSYTAEIAEGQTVESLLRVSATDLDSMTVFNQIQYFIDSSSITLAQQYSIFLNEDTGVLTTTNVFDYERDTTQIVLMVVAIDIGGYSSTATVIVNVKDKNEFAPRFIQQSHNISIPENYPVGIPFYTFSTTDDDGGPLFGTVQRFIVQRETSPTPFRFSIGINGTLSLSQRLDYETQDVLYSFMLVAIDGGGLQSEPAAVSIHVLNEDDSPPVFDPVEYSVSVGENIMPASNEHLLKLNVISESSYISLEVTSEEYTEHFELTNDGYLSLRQSLDFETVQEVTLKVRAFDGSLYSDVSATVRVIVEPKNDNRPVFVNRNLTASLTENLVQNSLQVTLEATDNDSDDSNTIERHGDVTRYELLNSSVPFMLIYNRNQRSVLLTNSRPLDAEVDPVKYTLVIQAFDGQGLSAEVPATVVIRVVDVDDNQPSFDQAFYAANVRENFVGVLLDVHATDLDRDFTPSLMSYIVSGQDSSMFTVLANGSVMNIDPFDYEVDKPMYSFTVSIQGCDESIPGCSSSVEVILQDENDNSPTFLFEEYSFSLAFDSFPIFGSIVGRVSAMDDDKGQLYGDITEYSVKGDSEPFSVHSSTGDIVVNDPPTLRQQTRNVRFEIVATDGGGLSSSTQVEVVIPVFNLHAPMFEQRFYYISWEENFFNFRLPGLPTNAFLQVRAQDLDRPFSTVTYHLLRESKRFQMMEDGFLLLKAPLDWEETSEYFLQARAFDGLYNSTFNADIRIVVVNQNDNPPVFTQTTYNVNISEHYRTFSSPIAQVHATDQDSSRIQLSFSILDPTAPFRIDFQGNLYVLTHLDYEVTKKYRFSVSVSDGSHEAESPAEVTVRLIDENDHYPFFSQPVYQVSLAENTSPGSLTFAIFASDLDSSPEFGEIASYSILENHVPFEVSYNALREAFITNTRTLDYESDHHVYVFHVHAHDKGGLRSFFPAQVIVTLVDTDDCPPIFSEEIYAISVNENAQTPTFLTKVSASDCDINPQYTRVDFTLPNSLGLFSVHPVSGVVMALRSFDLEGGTPFYEVEIIARSATDLSLSDSAVLNITVQDVNEFHPQFIGTPYKIVVPENTVVGTIVSTFQATDKDTGSVYGMIETYLIMQNKDSLPFILNSTTGELTLTSELDYESGITRFDIHVAAADGGMLATQTTAEVIVTNVEDEPPYFTQTEYSLSVNENEFDFFLKDLPQNALLQLKAVDGDSLVTDLIFTLDNSSLDSSFRIDSEGYLYLRHPLDYETISAYQLLVSVADGIYASEQYAVVDIKVINNNDQAPVFYECLDGCCGNKTLTTSLIVQVNENTIPDSPLVSLTACDMDGDSLEYTINNSLRLFTINNGELRLIEMLDYEVQTLYRLEIISSDGEHNSTNHVQISLEVVNMDDNDLKFDNNEYGTIVKENSLPGELNLTILATDADLPGASIDYNIQSSSTDLPFQLQQRQDGSLLIMSTRAFDFESSQEWYIFNVTARSRVSESLVQQISTAEVTILIKDVNEFRPMFKSELYNTSLAENSMGKAFVKVTAVDEDSGDVYGHVSYRLLDVPELPCIITEEGEIINTEPMDAEREPVTLEMTVEATDGGGLKSTTRVRVTIIDENDHVPFFSPVNYYALLPEDSSIDKVVMVINAIDHDRSADFSEIKEYRVQSSQQDLPFTIDISGSIKVSKPLDYETGPMTYVFTVSAVDAGGLVSEVPARITIDIANIPDQPPIFSQPFYTASVLENSANNTIVVQLFVTSKDGGNVLCELDNQEAIPFTIGDQSAIITVDGRVDFEEQQVYEFGVICYSSSNASSTANVRVNIVNTNDHPPVFVQSVYRTTIEENSPRGTLSLEIQAVDADIGNAGLIHEFQLYSSSDDFFVKGFNQSSGTALISNLNAFDYEMTRSVELHIRAIDRGRPPMSSDSATIVIDIIDVNDNVPKLSQDVYFTSFKENSVGIVLSVSATDLDQGTTSGVITSYQIQPPTHPFNVSKDGIIRVSESIDYETFSSSSLSRIQFSIIAFDGSGLSSRPALVYINILNENDNTPRALHANEWPVKMVEIEWETPVSAEPVFTLSAVDDDKGDSLFFFLDTVSIDLPFTLPHLKSGDIILQRPLTKLTSYEFVVTVQDRHPLFLLPDTNSIQWQVQVEIVDTNSPPYFSKSQLIQLLTITEGTTVLNRPVLQLIAFDDDYPNSDFATILGYVISPLNLSPEIPANSNMTYQLPFQVTSNGEVIVTRPLLNTQYAFSISAIDGGGLVTPDPVALTVLVQESNDHAPVFKDEQLRVSLVDSDEIGSIVTEIIVTDADEGMSGEVQCSIKENVTYFEINADTCTLYLKESLIDQDLEGTVIDLTIIATDTGLPPLSSSSNLRVFIVSASDGKLELTLNMTEVTFVEEQGPVRLIQMFELGSERVSPGATYSLSVSLSPGLSKPFSPDLYTSQCLADRGLVDVHNCFVDSLSLLSLSPPGKPGSEHEPVHLSSQNLSPSSIRRGVSSTFLYQTWFKTNHVGNKSLLGAYASDSTQNDPVFFIQISHNSVSVVLSNSETTYSVELPNGVLLNDNIWHHLAVYVLSQDRLSVYIDGSNVGSSSFDYDLNLLPDQLYLYTGIVKSSVASPYMGHVWKTSIKFGFKQSDLLSSLSCMLSCGEGLNTDVYQDSEISWSVSSHKLEVQTDDFQTLLRLIAALSYDNIATEPTTHARHVTVLVADDQSRTNATIAINTALVNEHNVSFRLNIRRSSFYYVDPQRAPHAAVLANGLQLTDMDTTQTTYTARIDITPPNERSCDRLDYSVKIKLEQCLDQASDMSVPSVYNLLPIYQWRIHELFSVQQLSSSLLGYYFYGTGIFIPDMTIYNHLELAPEKFSVVFWTQYNAPGTIAYIRNETVSFLFQLRANATALTMSYSNENRPLVTLSWPWAPREGWMHVALTFDNHTISLCVDGTECSSHMLPVTSNPAKSFSGFEAYIGAVPGSNPLNYRDRFSGALNGLSLLSDFVLPLEILNCIIACSERIVLDTPSLLDKPLLPLIDSHSTGIASVNGTLQIAEKLKSNELQDVLRHVAYINSHPYQYPGTRQISYSVYDGPNLIKPLTTARLVVLYHGRRTVGLLRLGRQTLTAESVISGTNPFTSVGITSDSKSDTIDSLLVEMTSLPASSRSCYQSQSSSIEQCHNIFHLDKNLLTHTNLDVVVKPKKLLIFGLGNVSYYQDLLHQIVIQSDNPSDITTRSSEVNIRVYISDMNGISSSSKTTTLFVRDSPTGSRKKREASNKVENHNIENRISLRPLATSLIVVCTVVSVLLILGVLVFRQWSK